MYIKHCINELIGTKVSVTMLSKVNRSKTMKKERAISKCNFLGLSDNHPPKPPPTQNNEINPSSAGKV